MRLLANRASALLAALAATLLLLTVPEASPAHATNRTVTMSGYAFAPATLTITAGGTVTWTNQDTAPHNVKTTSAPVALDSPMLNRGGTWSYTFTTPGTYRYYCTVHPEMTATLVVSAPPKTTPPPAATTHPAARYTTAAAVPPRRTSTSVAPVTSSSRSTPSAAAPAPSSPAATTTTATGPAPVQVQVAAGPASSSRPLPPLLLLTGVVTAVAVVCLLLVGSRTQQQRGG
jgi:amicyanin